MKYAIIVITLLLFVNSCSPKQTKITINEKENSDNQVSTTETKAQIDESKPLIEITKEKELQIYVRADGAPGMYLGEDGNLHGFYVELEKAVMKEMGQKYKLIAYDNLGPVIQKIKTGEGHSALAVPEMEDYKVFLNLSNSYEVLEFVPFVQESNTSIEGTTFDEVIKSMIGKKIGVQTRAHIYQKFRSYKDLQLIEYPTTTQALEDLSKGNLDVVPDVKRIGLYYSKQNNWAIKPINTVVFSIDLTTGFSQAVDPEIIDRYNAALATLKKNGTIDRLYKESFAEYLN